MKHLIAIPLGLLAVFALASPATADSYFAFSGTIHVGSSQDGGINRDGRGRQTLRNISLGLDFEILSRGILVTDLGMWDDNEDGLASYHSLAVYDTDTQTLLASVDTTGDDGFLHEGFRYFPLSMPLPLSVGDDFTIVIYYPTDNLDSNGNSGRTDQGLEPTPIFNDGGGAIINVNGGRYGFGEAFPTRNDTGPANRYHSGSFRYSANPEPSTLLLVSTALGGFALVLRRKRR